MKRAVFALVCACLPMAAARSVAVPGPENTLIVVNAASEDSVVIAREYVRLRRIPACNVLYLRDVPDGGVIKADDFRARILRPIFDTIRDRGLDRQIDCVAYSAGFPYAVNVAADMSGRTFPRYITQPASLTGLTYLHQLALAADPAYLELNSNRYYRDRKLQRRDTPWTERDRRLRAELETAVSKITEAAGSPSAGERIASAAELAGELAQRHPASPEILYDLACLQSLKGDSAGAMATLRRAVDAGWLNVAHTEADPDLAPLRGRADFSELLQRMRATRVQWEPPLPFRAATRWSAQRSPTAAADGRRYMLAAMLAYTGTRANTLDEALACLRRSVAADGTRPSGTVYFMASSDRARTGPRQWAFEPARAALLKLGVRAEIVSGVLPQGKSDVVGAVVGAATFDWSKTGSRIAPGAFCDHLTSLAGVMTGGGQTLLSEWIKAGAAGSSGTVTEPYNLQAKFPTPFLHVFYASGCSLAEAFYQSVAGPYQQLLVGDPLCAPWSPRLSVKVVGLQNGALVKKTTRMTVTCSGAKPVRRCELYIDGRLKSSALPGRPLLLDPANLAPGPHEARVVAVAGTLEWRGRAIIRFRTGR